MAVTSGIATSPVLIALFAVIRVSITTLVLATFASRSSRRSLQSDMFSKELLTAYASCSLGCTLAGTALGEVGITVDAKPKLAFGGPVGAWAVFAGTVGVFRVEPLIAAPQEDSALQGEGRITMLETIESIRTVAYNLLKVGTGFV